jgi:hypothetical protein
MFTPEELEIMRKRNIPENQITAELQAMISDAMPQITSVQQYIEQQRYYEEWNGQSLNGIDLERHPNVFIRAMVRKAIETNSKIYIVYNNGVPAEIQFFQPFLQGHQPVKQVRNVAQQHIKKHAEEEAKCKVVENLKRALLKKYGVA